MSTSDPKSLVLNDERGLGEAPALPDRGSFPAGVPDPAVLARMANELFTALPSSLEVPQHPSAIDPPASVPVTAPAFQPEVQLPSDKHLPTLPASIGPAQVAPVSAPYQAGPPAVPGVVGTATDAGSSGGAIPPSPTFSFLQDARPIFSDRPAYAASPELGYSASVPATPQVAPPSSSPPQGRIGTVEDSLPRTAIEPQSPSMSMIPMPPLTEYAPAPPFSFLEELRPLFSYPPSIPGPAPAGTSLIEGTPFDLQLPNDLLRAQDISQLADQDLLRRFNTARPLEPADAVVLYEPAGIERDVPRELDLSKYPFDAEAIKRDFPILRERVNGRPLVWLDNAATTQKPQSVIDRLKYFYEHENSNVHRAAHELAARATDAYESAREKVRRFVNASSTQEIVFVRGATEGINLIAQSWGRRNVRKDDEIVITWLEHHANIVPWQMLCSETGAKLRVAPVDDSGQVLLDEYEKLLGPKTRMVSMTQVSNALGVVTPAEKMIEIAHRYGARVLLDGAQSVSHMRVDVQSLDCDFFVFSGHKVFGPTGIGVVYGKPEVLEGMPPWQGGGNMIQDVTFEKTRFHAPPQRFEAGTGNIADAVGLGAAIDYLDRVGMPNVSRHEHELLVQATKELLKVPGLHIIGTAKEKAGVLSFVLDGFRTEDVGSYLNKNGIAVRSGHHCAQPILRRFGQESSVRASLALYNTHEDIDKLVTAIWDLRLGRTSIA
ncbi:SufS family cysteine desulfurase [Terriglobus albidus]|uniref:Cysteine desulfurase n=1 Tax=Terriglobus albidus TaxID=1592106 RepID=A0A5B9EAL3_9BACT|nr:family 2A encapsulin nanocompartment cargo protein cysteine desulfurase [Terriglobus albidus]QEE29193.1 SufS family cysteine desulfurase [Terriglobus albidus]